MKRVGVSQRELARRLADLDGGKPESKRRWIVKLLRDEVERPEPGSVSELEQALGVGGGYFTAARPASVTARRDRLAALEAEVAQLREERDSALEAVVARLAGLEAALAAVAPRSVRQPSAKRSRR